jgi:hypothetical protein
MWKVRSVSRNLVVRSANPSTSPTKGCANGLPTRHSCSNFQFRFRDSAGAAALAVICGRIQTMSRRRSRTSADNDCDAREAHGREHLQQRDAEGAKKSTAPEKSETSGERRSRKPCCNFGLLTENFRLSALDSKLRTFNCERTPQLLLKFIERMKLPRSLSIFFCN